MLRIKRNYNKLYELNNEIILAHYECDKGYIYYEHVDDPTKQMYEMTSTEFMKWKRVYYEGS